MGVIIQMNSEKQRQKEVFKRNDTRNIPTNRDCNYKKPSLILPVIFNVNRKIQTNEENIIVDDGFGFDFNLCQSADDRQYS